MMLLNTVMSFVEGIMRLDMFRAGEKAAYRDIADYCRKRIRGP